LRDEGISTTYGFLVLFEALLIALVDLLFLKVVTSFCFVGKLLASNMEFLVMLPLFKILNIAFVSSISIIPSLFYRKSEFYDLSNGSALHVIFVTLPFRLIDDPSLKQ